MEQSNASHDTLMYFRRDILNKLIKDTRFVGMFYIIYGAITCIFIITAIIGIPYIIMGVRLRESAINFSKYMETSDETEMNFALEKQQRFYFINKVLIIVALIFFALYIIGLIFVVSTGVFDLPMFDALEI